MTIEELDAKVLGLVADGTVRNADIAFFLPLAELPQPPSGTLPPGRVVDRSLQRLRKAGKVAFKGGAWSVTGKA